MDMDKLNEVYDGILGETGDSIATTESEPEAKAKGDPAYQDPDYSGQKGDKVDPRDPTTFPEKDAEPEPDDEPQGPEVDEEYEDIPDELVAAGRQAGLTDEEIIDLDAEKPAVLKALAEAQKRAIGPAQEKRAPAEPAPAPDKKPEPKAESLELKFDLPGLDDELSQVAGPVQEVVNKLLNRVTQLEEGLGKTQAGMADVEKGREAEMFRQVDVFFDNQAEQLPELGNTKDLKQPHVDARIFAWNVANDLMTGSGGKTSLQDALAIGVNALRGRVSETKLKARVVSELNKQKSKFSPRPRGSRRGPDKPKGEEERGLAAINEILDDPKYQ